LFEPLDETLPVFSLHLRAAGVFVNDYSFHEADCFSAQSFQPPPGAGAQDGAPENDGRPVLFAPNNEGTFST